MSDPQSTPAQPSNNANLDALVHDHVRWLSRSKSGPGQLNLSGAALHGLDLPARAIATSWRTQLDGALLNNTKWSKYTFKSVLFQASDLRHATFESCTFINVSFSDAVMSGSVFNECHFEHTTFSKADLTDASFQRCRFGKDTGFAHVNGTRLQIVNCSRMQPIIQNEVHFVQANLDHSVWTDTRLPRSNFGQSKMTGARCNGLDISGSTLLSARWHDVDFAKADLSGIQAGAAMTDPATLTQCRFNGAILRRAILRAVVLDGSDLSDSELHLADFEGASVRDARFVNAKGLFGLDAARLTGMVGTEWAIVHAQRDRISWDFIRSVGSISLFTASGIVVFGVLWYGRIVAWYNERLEQVHQGMLESTWGDRFVGLVPGPLPFPPEFIGLLIATLVLALASIVFRLSCPALVREYTETRWERELKAPVLEYKSAAYSHPWRRWITFALYLAGGVFVGSYLAWRITTVLSWWISHFAK